MFFNGFAKNAFPTLDSKPINSLRMQFLNALHFRPARAPSNTRRRPAGWQLPTNRSTETKKLSINHAVGGNVMVAFVSTNRPERLRTQDSIDGTMIVPGASEAALNLY